MKANQEELLEAAMPLIEWLQKNGHPHMKAIVDNCGLEVVEGVVGLKSDGLGNPKECYEREKPKKRAPRYDLLKKLVKGVKHSEFEGIGCNSVDGKSWFDMRDLAEQKGLL